MKRVYEITDGDDQYYYVASSKHIANCLHSEFTGSTVKESDIRIMENSEVIFFSDKIEADENFEYEGDTVASILESWEKEHAPKNICGMLCTTEYM